MNKKYVYPVVLIVLIAFGFSFLPGRPLQKKIADALQMFNTHFYQEKVYLQFDKDNYVAGRTIWYKAYITLNRKPTKLSTILYVDLLNDTGKVVQRNKRPIKEGGAYGDFELDTALAAGNYRIRAYTLWMRNFNPAFFFTKDIHIYNPKEKKKSTLKNDTVKKDAVKKDTLKKDTLSSDFAVQFFPEGGYLVDSLKSVVAFKAINQHGLPTKVKGIIKNKRGEIIDSIQSIHDGMGSFEFRPQTGVTYFAEMKDTAGQIKTFELPEPKEQGVVLKVMKINNDRVYFRVKRKVKNKKAHNNYELVAQSQGTLTYMAGINFAQGYIAGVVPTKTNPAGILQLTLFSEEGIPIAERLVFLKKDKAKLQLHLNSDTVSLQPRKKNVYTIDLPDSIKGTFSAAVTDADQVLQSYSQDNIISNLLLTNDIKGYVYNPAWYFEKKDSATERGLKLVMLTNGWRRFEWEKILHNEYPEIDFLPEPNGLYFIGKIHNRKGPVAQGKISILLKNPSDSSSQFLFGKAEPSGLFKIDHLSFMDSAYLYYKAQDPEHKRRPVEVEFSEGAKPENRMSDLPIYSKALPFSDSVRNMLSLAEERNRIAQLISNRSILLNEVEVTASKKSQKETVEDRYTSGRFKARDGISFDLTDRVMPYTNILEFLVGKVAGLQVRALDPTHPSVKWRGGTPGFFIDEIPTDIDQVTQIPVDNVAFIKVFRPPFMASFGGANGAIAIYTRKGSDIRMAPGKGLTEKKVMGYTLVKDFYSPQYPLDKNMAKTPDKRATLYWNPTLKVDSSHHKLKISFYNSDIAKRIRVVLEGMTKDGKLVHLDTVIE